MITPVECAERAQGERKQKTKEFTRQTEKRDNGAFLTVLAEKWRKYGKYQGMVPTEPENLYDDARSHEC